MDIGGNIKKLRLMHKMEQKDLAKLLHVSDKTVSSWETNRTQPKMEMIEAMCVVFKCQKSDFLSDSLDHLQYDGEQYLHIQAIPVTSPEEQTEHMIVTPTEKIVLQSFRALTSEDKHMALKLFRLMRYYQLMSKENKNQ